MSAETVPFPTAVGPASTVSRAGMWFVAPWRSGTCGAGWPAGGAEMSAKPLDERLGLVRPEAAYPASLGDPDLFHDRPSLHLTDTWQRLQQRDDLELAHDVVFLPLLDHVLERALGVLQPVLDLGAHTTRLRSLLESCSTLFRGEWRKGHASHLLVSRR